MASKTKTKRNKASTSETIVETETVSETESSPTSSMDLDGMSAETRIIIEFMSEKLNNAINEIKNIIQQRDNTIDNLEQEIRNLKKDNLELRDRLDEVETYQRRNTLIITGDKTPIYAEGENVVNVALNVIREQLKIKLSPDDISVAHRLGRKPVSQMADKRSILIKLNKHEKKEDLIQACRTVKPPQFFMNENLTPQRANILYVLRKAKKIFPEKVDGSGSHNGRVYVWIKAPNPTARKIKHFIGSKSKLEEFCTKTLGESASNIVNNTRRE